jgi:hypothetical protein
MKQNKKLALAAVGMMAFAQAAFATNITIADGQANSTQTTGATGQGGEDQETEFNTLTTQTWDLEGFAVNGNTLSIVGGFPMTTFNTGYPNFKLGDIFVDIDGNAVLPPASGLIPVVGGHVSNAAFHYDYAIHFTRDGSGVINGFNVYGLNNLSTLVAIDNEGIPALNQSNPYQFLPSENGNPASAGTGSLLYTTGYADGNIGGTGVIAIGGSHNILALTFTSGVNPLLFPGDIHITQGCGNDNLLGEVKGGGQVPDGGATLVLLGLGLASLTLVSRKSVKA